MKNYVRQICLVVGFLVLSPNIIYAQLHLGISADVGNRVTFHPDPQRGLLKNPVCPSGAITVLMNEEIRNNWYVQYGTSLGTLGYRMYIRDNADTLYVLSGEPSYSHDGDFSTIYFSANLMFGKQIFIRSKPVGFFVGGGITHYWNSVAETTYSVCNETDCDDIFNWTRAGNDDRLKGFFEASFLTDITTRLIMGVRYRQHYTPAVSGTYNFYHMSEPASGGLSVTQKTISILFLIRMGQIEPIRE